MNKTQKTLLLSAFFFVSAQITLASCTKNRNSSETTNSNEQVEEQAIEEQVEEENAFSITIDADRTFARLRDLVNRGNRYYGAPSRPEQIQYLTDQLDEITDETRLQSFSVLEPSGGETFELTNIIGRYHVQAQRRIILGSHWDTRLWAEEEPDPTLREDPIIGANDGTSGVAAILEILTILNEDPTLIPDDFGIDVVLFDGEEFGRPGSNNYCQGSREFTEILDDLYGEHLPVSAIVLDMVADRDLAFLRERNSFHQARALQDLVWTIGQEVAPNVFLDQNGVAIYDDHVPLLQAEIPAILVIDLDYPYWHTQADTIDKCTPSSLAITTEVILRSVISIAKSR